MQAALPDKKRDEVIRKSREQIAELDALIEKYKGYEQKAEERRERRRQRKEERRRRWKEGLI